MKILYDHQIYLMQKFGGISRYFNEIMKIEKEGIGVERIIPELVHPATPAKDVSIYTRGYRFLKRKIGITPDITSAEMPGEISNKLADPSYDIFHPTYYDPYFLDRVSKPFVLTVYDMIHEIFKEYFPLADPTSHNKRLLCEKASRIIAISHNTKKDLVDIFNIPEEKIHAIHLASDFDQVQQQQPEHTEGLENYILFVGTRGGYKNFYFPVTALAAVLQQDRSLQLVCTGVPFGNEEMQFFKDLGIANQVKQVYLKNDNELAWIYRHASLFIFPSLYEGFGFPLLEAFASNCPVISSRGGSLSEVGADAALYFDPRNVQEIRDVASKAIYDSATRNIMIERGRKVFSQYSWNRCREETIRVYRSVADN